MSSLNEYRRQLDMIDAHICYLLEKRVRLLGEIDKCREEYGMSTDQPDRARHMLSRVRNLSARHGEAVGRAYGEIIKIGRGADFPCDGDLIDLNDPDGE